MRTIATAQDDCGGKAARTADAPARAGRKTSTNDVHEREHERRARTTCTTTTTLTIRADADDLDRDHAAVFALCRSRMGGLALS
jgi:hypothetical protein